MPDFLPPDPLFESRVRASFARQQVMHTIGALLTTVTPGAVEIALPFREDLTQQHGFLHAGIVATVLDRPAVTPHSASCRRTRPC